MHFLTSTSLLLFLSTSEALKINFDSHTSISAGAKAIVDNIISTYNGPLANNTTPIPGIFPAPYYWYESGMAWDSLINYWSLTGDATHNELVKQALLFQVGPEKNYLPPNQTHDEGNDDQSFWALACMTAAEKGFPAPSGGVKSWVELAQNVFDSQAARWDASSCGGGLRWQIFPFNDGYDYKNAASNGNFLQLAARLAHYTGNQTYSTWAEKTAKWSWQSGLVSEKTGVVYDGFNTGGGCAKPSKIEWTANLGTYLSGFSFLANTSGSHWQNNADTEALAINDTFAWQPKAPKDGIITETACQPEGTCNTDSIAYRAVLARSMATYLALTKDSSNKVPHSNYTLHESIAATLRSSAEGAAAQCSGGKSGNVCGSAWYKSKWDGTSGLSQDLSALEVILANMPSTRIDTSKQTGSTVGTSSGSVGGSGSSMSGAQSLSGPGAVVLAVSFFATSLL